MDSLSTTGRVIECRAAVAWEKYKPMVIETIQVVPPKAGEVRIKSVAAGICYSDIYHLKGESEMALFPLVLGHEGSAIVESIGEGVTDFSSGDHVIPLWKPECQKCKLCKHPGTNLCEKIKILLQGKQSDGTARFFKDGKPIYQLVGVGSFSEYCVVPEFCLVKVNKKAPISKLASFGCCFPTGYGAAINTAGVRPGTTAVVFGLGAVGLCAVLGCRDAGATRIIGVDINPQKFEIGRKFGCTDLVNPNSSTEPIHKVLKTLTDGGVDYALVAVGKKAALESALLSCADGYGKAVMIGLIEDTNQIIETHYFEFIWGKTLTGTWCGGCNCLIDIPKFVNMYVDGKLNEVNDLTTQEIKLEDINEGLSLLENGQTLRSMIIF